MAGFGGSVKLTGENEYKNALKEITNNLTILSSEMKITNSEFDKSDKSVDGLKNTNEKLNKQIDDQVQKILGLKQALYNAQMGYGENSKEATKWQAELNSAKAELNVLNRELDKNDKALKDAENALDDAGEELDDFADGAEDAGKSAVKMGDLIKANLISEAIIGGLKALGAVMVDIAKKAVDLGKNAIQNYAEYEQLIGGVETLFKESSGTVEEYANNAYKTAGLSANEYMSTVTSFSASLLQSLNGDTEKSAQVADMAITDMADNANKMGTSMESIQTAYQGFAKQNYTMLDNLKLGYGGTKTEMERLLKDATAISGVEYDISSLSDVYNAIHVIQGELGITGTTAKEASTTIQGSLSSMKSAWQNLLTGIADENADFGALIDNFVDSILTVGDNLIPRIQQVIQGAGELVSGLLSALIPEIVAILPPLIESTLPTLIASIETAITSIIAVLPQLTGVLESIIPQLIITIVDMLPLLIDAGITIILSLVNGIVASIPTLIPAVVEAIITIAQNLIGNIDQIIDAGIQLIMGLADGLIEAIPIIIDASPTLIDSLVNGIFGNLPKLVEAGIQLIIGLGVGLIRSIPMLVAQIPNIIRSVINAFTSYRNSYQEIGSNILKGIWDGIVAWTGALWQNIVDIGNTIVGWFEDVLGIHSPSDVMADKIGKNMALGVGEGFSNTMAGVTEQMAGAIPTDFDIEATASGAGTSTNMFATMVDAFKQALKEVNIVLDDEVAGRFVLDTVEKVIYT